MVDINKIAWNEVEITRSGPIRYVTREPTNGISIALRPQRPRPRPRRRRARQHCYFMFSMRIYARFASEFHPATEAYINRIHFLIQQDADWRRN